LHIRSHLFGFEALSPRVGFETVARQELGSAGEILFATPAVPFQFTTDARMASPQAAPQVTEAELFFPLPIDERPFCMIEMTVILAHTPPPVT